MRRGYPVATFLFIAFLVGWTAIGCAFPFRMVLQFDDAVPGAPSDTPLPSLPNPSSDVNSATPPPFPYAEVTVTSIVSSMDITATSESIDRLEPGAQVSIRTISMIDSSAGWAISEAINWVPHILRTEDGAETWRDVTPPMKFLSPYPVGNAIMFAQNCDTAWVIYEVSLPQEVNIVWRSDDGGETWQASQPLNTVLIDGAIGRFTPLQLFFVDGQSGWLSMVAEGSNFLFRTTDGGLTWERVIDQRHGDHGNWHAGHLTGMAFADPAVGAVSYEAESWDGRFLLDWTEDGGLTWTTQEFPPPFKLDMAQAHLAGDCGTHSPIFFSPTAMVFALGCRFSGGVLYATLDSGQTWRSSNYPGGLLPMDFINPQEGWAWSAALSSAHLMPPSFYLFSTADGGRNWNMRGESIEGFDLFDFVNEETGWLIISDYSGRTLLKTANGGASWKVLTPQIGPSP